MEIALFLDIDGTLLEHQEHPDGVKVDEDLRRLIRETSVRLDGALAVVTGRTIEMVDRLFLPLELPAAGLFGLEMRLKPGDSVAALVEPSALSAVTERLAARFGAVEGLYFERKGPILAIHLRGAPEKLKEVLAAAEEALPELDNYRIAAGNAGLELIPIDVVKASAIARFMGTPPFTGRHAVFIGDDTSDESGFDHVNSIGGLSIRVKPNGPTAATMTVPNVAGVLDWIRRLGK